jgi:hypothetical protein
MEAIQSRCFLWSSTEYTLWNGKGEKIDVPGTASLFLGHQRGVLISKQMAAQSGLGPLGVLELHHRARLWSPP